MDSNAQPIIPDKFITSVETQILTPLITVLALAAFVLFAFGVFELIRGGGNEEARKKGRTHIMYGLIGLTIIFGASIIVQIIQKSANSINSL